MFDSSQLIEIFTKSNVVFLLWFLAIYILLSFLLKIIFGSNSETNNMDLFVSRIFDFVLFFVIVIAVIANPDWVNWDYQVKNAENLGERFQHFANENISVFATAFFIFVFYTLIFVSGIPMSYGNKSFFVSMIESAAWFVLFISALNLFFNVVFHFSLVDVVVGLIADVWKATPAAAAAVETKNIPPDGTTLKKEVFQVSNNIYTYEEAQSVCSAVGAKLASYDQVEEAYLDGGEWCNYGWAEDQMALYPTQKDTWKKLQENENTKHNCGRPGINGGYMSNPQMKFGVNCYGVKPKPKDSDVAKLDATQNIIHAKTPEELALENKIQQWKNNADQMLNISSFNMYKWNENP